MKSLFVLVLLLLPMPLWAEQHTLSLDVDQTPGKQYEMWVKVRESGGGQPTRCWIGTNEQRETVPCDCEARMEAAMRAMEPWMLRMSDDKVDGQRIMNWTFQTEKELKQDPAYIQFRSSWVLWDAVKRDCWKETP